MKFSLNAHDPVKSVPVIVLLLTSLVINAQTSEKKVVVGLDNWFNHETNVKTGLPFHYLWNDTADSGFSRWGKLFEQRGAMITTLDKPVKTKLSRVNIYIIVDPDSVVENPHPNYIQPDDITAIERWVKKGGVLVLMANDGKHCGLTYLNHLSARFGMIFNNVMLRPVLNNQYEMGAFINLPDHPVFKDLKKIYMKEVSSIRLSGNSKPVLTDDGQAIIAECSYGKGFVFAIGDPWIYNEYIDHDRLPVDFENHRAAENLTGYLLGKVKH